MSKVDQIMLQFRPIAPKPASADGYQPKRREAPARWTKGKQRYGTREGTRRLGRKRKATAVTLSLLPETPVMKDPPVDELDPAAEEAAWQPKNRTAWISSDDDSSARADIAAPDRSAVMAPLAVRVVGSCVTVERVTDAWVDGETMTDKERRRYLERDTCPGFVSDTWNRVSWTNGAYRRMVGEEEGDGSVVAVWVVMKEKDEMVARTHAAFSCRVRVQYTCGKGKEGSSLTLPADVWRMDGGGFAWRLDTDAALSLGR